jgi:AcrR family transcriptional regulator
VPASPAPPEPSGPADPARERLKAAALRLFSARGIDGVSVRDVVKAAGLRNGAALHYYFGSKEALARELVIDGAHRSDRERRRRLDALERAGGPRSPAEVVRVIVETETAPPARGAPPVGFGHMRFVAALQGPHRRLLQVALEDGRNEGYLRCQRHLRRLMPEVPEPVMRRRLVFLNLFLGSALAAREAAFEADATGGALWGRPEALDDLVASATGLLGAPVYLSESFNRD